MSTAAVILAAGRSARLSQPKQLVQVHGETLARRAARVALEAGCAPVIVVEGAVPLAGVLEGLRCEVAHCERWADGPGASLRAGVEALGQRAEGVVVLLVDQYRVGAPDVRALIEAPGDVAAAAYGGSLGVPARFSRGQVEVLRSLPADSGARAWLRSHLELVTPVPMPHAEADLDEPAQLAELTQGGRGDRLP